MKNVIRMNKVLVIISTVALSLNASTAAPKQEAGGYEPYIPLDKGLDDEWVSSLHERGERRVYKGDELRLISMPCGGIGAGQAEITGDGRLCFTESVYNKMQEPNAGHGLSTGYQYLHPTPVQTKVENGFSVTIKQAGKPAQTFTLDREGFDDIRFVGEYPMAQFAFRSKSQKLPVEIDAEVFSPFVPLSVRSSANPVTVLRYTLHNTSQEPVELTLAGHLKPIPFPQENAVRYHHSVKQTTGLTGVSDLRSRSVNKKHVFHAAAFQPVRRSEPCMNSRIQLPTIPR